MTQLMGPNERVYALAQGQVVAGGYSFESDLNRQQRNYPTTATLEGGATVEAPVDAQILGNDGTVGFLLSEPDFGTANRIAETINARLGANIAMVQNADEVRVRYDGARPGFAWFMSRLEAVLVEPGQAARVVVNERTGTIVAGGAVRLSSVVIAQGDIRVRITGQRTASQPSFVGGYASDIASLVVTNTKLEVEQGQRDAVVSLPNTTVADLVLALTRAHVDTRGIISVLQAVKAAGALHAEIIVQ
ncbi:flagellar biosynthesis protein FlgA [Novosphingobium fuchskuhlense]|uniref:Flagellar P-ring protein n=2 Tax=Novosphingobium fuchskuhlense TaxID=1117702 RepID=A0A124JT99_9SPHN|nr:flagellar biosynthesis protein FlgA [Novosphingobium fuchskuhlense]